MSTNRKPIQPLPTEPKALEPTHIYTLLDNRARDYRTILIAIVAACVGLFVAFVNSLATCVASTNGRVGDCSTDWVPLVYLNMIAILFFIAIHVVGPEVRATAKRAEFIRENFIPNRRDVPVIDELLVGHTREDMYIPASEDTRSPDQDVDPAFTPLKKK